MDIFLIPAVLAVIILAVVAWNVFAWPKVSTCIGVPNVPPQSVSILIPARNEERHLPACLDAALQQGEVVAEVLVYDDHSTDASAQIICAAAALDERVRLVNSTALAAGWCGKNFACAQLAQAARTPWMLFLDADARLATGAVARMVAEAERRQVTLLSCWPGLVMKSGWEKALMPMLNFVVFTLYPAPLALLRNDASLGLAHGACLLVERASYEAIGGHTAVRDQIFEDTRLAQLWRAQGQHSLCLDGQELVQVQMYNSFREIWRGFQKNFYLAFRHAASFWAFLALHTVVFLAPFFGLGWSRAAALAAAGVVLMRTLLTARFHHPWWSVLVHPLSEVILLALGLSSWWRCRSGKGVTWKGRVYRSSNTSKA